MSRLVVLKLGTGNWQQGFPIVIVQLWEANRTTSMQWTGSLPAAPKLAELYQQWRSLYVALYHRLNGSRLSAHAAIEFEDGGITNVSEKAFHDLSQPLKHQLDSWLDADSFRKIDRQLRVRFLPSEEIRVIVETENCQLRRFPWHLWSFFDDYPYAEVALSTPEFGRVETVHRVPIGRVRILAILGNSQGIDVQHDRAVLEQLPTAETIFLVEPQRQELDQWLWDEQGWDILFFAGHSISQADGATGEIWINPTDRLTVVQLKNALKAAIVRGLKLAIFNSCDGLGLAREMADLNIPQLVVMREPVPDRVAQEFLKHWLTAFANGKSFYQSVREAREKLQGLEDHFLCASWLPVICQNPAETPPNWQNLLGEAADDISEPLVKPVDEAIQAAPVGQNSRGDRPPRSGWCKLRIGLLTGAIVTSVVMGVRFLGILQAWELTAFDHLMRMRPPEIIDPRILVVEVTQQDTKQYGYPLEDAKLAELIGKLEAYQPTAIGLDMHRAMPRGEGRAEFINQFQQHQNLFIVCSFGRADQNAPPPEFSEEQRIGQVGFSDLVLEGTNSSEAMRDDLLDVGQFGAQGDMVRRQLLSYDPTLVATPSPCITPYSLSFQLAFRFFSQTGIQPIAVNADQDWQFGTVTFRKLPARFAGYQQLDGLNSQILINYRTDLPGARVMLEDILQGWNDRNLRNLVENRIVLIGTTAPTAKDSFDTLYGEMPGVWIHAHMLSQMLSAVMDDRPLIWALPQWGEFQWGDLLWILVWSSVGGVLAWRLRSWLWLGLANAIATVLLHQLCLIILTQGGWMPLVPSLLVLWVTSGVARAAMTSDVRRQS
ncbi:MAG: CHASE2 domain-containing protein [Cyanobacteria bacterium RU_5_0]|nr:CHASE2 domain-containing protein [Cyanobacteria bacterium RU_5_0]